MEKLHIMIDLETLDTTPFSAILAIGAVGFVATQQPTTSFLSLVSLEDNLSMGRTVSASTIKWWMEQDPEAQKLAFSGKRLLENSLRNLDRFIKNRMGEADAADVCVWGNGATFDITILEEAYRQCRMPVPWKFWNVRCYRTISNLVPKDFYPWAEGTKHHAANDAMHQAKRLLAIASELNLNLS